MKKISCYKIIKKDATDKDVERIKLDLVHAIGEYLFRLNMICFEEENYNGRDYECDRITAKFKG
jgi:hypothetical protein